MSAYLHSKSRNLICLISVAQVLFWNRRNFFVVPDCFLYSATAVIASGVSSFKFHCLALSDNYQS